MLIHHLMRPLSPLTLSDPALHNVGTRLDRTESSAYDDIIEWAPEREPASFAVVVGCGFASELHRGLCDVMSPPLIA